MRRLLVPLVAALALAGCGVGPGEERAGGAQLRVTEDFGRERIGSVKRESVREGDTAMRLLRSKFDVQTRYGGRFVQSIGDLEGQGPTGRSDWFYWVNGLEGSVGAAEFELSPGDIVQWDFRRWGAAMRVPAIVGAFPEPFLAGIKGKRLPVRVECDDAEGEACKEAKRRLSAIGAKPTGGVLATGGGENVLRVVVAPWREARLIRAVRELEDGPEATGVFARFRGNALELLGRDGRAAERAPAGTGIVAALAPDEGQVLWLLTAPDEAGLLAAAQALTPGALTDAFAAAAGPGGVRKLPLASGEGAR